MLRPEISIDAVRKRFGRTTALDGVSFEAGGGVTALLGPNGAGKTTLLRILATVISPDSGDVRLLGRDARHGTERIEIRRRLGYMPQDPGFHYGFTAAEFVDYVAILKEITDRVTRREEVRRVLHAVGLDAKRDEKIKALSGGMRRRVALAQALLSEPELLVLDEPTVGLDPEQRLRFRETISRLGEERSVLLSTHQTEDVAALSGHVIVMHHGRTLFEGSPNELTNLANGKVWLADREAPSARLAWRTGEGHYRNVGEAPAGAELVAPSMEDGYLILVGAEARAEAA